MKLTALLVVGTLAAAVLCAQPRRGGASGGGYGPGTWTPQRPVGTWTAPPAPTFGHGFGNVVFPGGVRPGIANPWGGDSSFAQRLGATVGGWPPYTGAPIGAGRGVTAVVPVPVFAGGGFGYTGYPQVQTQPNVIVVAPQGWAPPMQQAPQVVINQHYTPDTAKPVMREYTAPSSLPPPEAPAAGAPASAADEPATIFLIAFRNGTIQAAYAYWTEGQTLHYVTTKGSHNRATLDQIDRELSERLNRERKVEFSLERGPAPR
ncbi:MAG TPA: hypothetical protein DEH78_20110 [Solibacterales bacterium]|nr:hypothetical protein [Bryobacterales bacterium]